MTQHPGRCLTPAKPVSLRHNPPRQAYAESPMLGLKYLPPNEGSMTAVLELG
jgi:hypothetical protein